MADRLTDARREAMLREALAFARDELHRALSERGSTEGYRASFDRINTALAAASPAPPSRESE